MYKWFLYTCLIYCNVNIAFKLNIYSLFIWKTERAHPPPSFSSFSIMAFRACEAEVLGIVWALMISFLRSACLRSSAAKPPPLREVSSSRSNTLGRKGHSASINLKTVHFAVKRSDRFACWPSDLFVCTGGRRGVAEGLWLHGSSWNDTYHMQRCERDFRRRVIISETETNNSLSNFCV